MTIRNLSGWIPDAYDPRDLSYSAPSEVAAALPSKTNNRAKFKTPVYEQGPIGSCGPHSCTSDIAFDGDVKGVTLRPSRLFGYYISRDVMGTINSDSGVSNREMLKAYARFGWCDESLWPYEPNRFKVKPPPEAYAQAATRKIETYLRVPQQLDQRKACLAGGDPFIFGFSVFSSMETPDVARTGNVPMPRQGDRQVGGHDVLIVDFDDDRQVFIFRNSWGDDWGEAGYGTIPYQYALHPQLASDFWTIRWSVVAPPSPPPEPGPLPDTPKVSIHLEYPDGRKWVADGSMRPDGTVSFVQSPAGVLN
ncbi:MAG: C1 family peptidase [Planctomycetaceae bacterium]|nr:C1 family peptidase [Planctomycetaceae bacterium]